MKTHRFRSLQSRLNEKRTQAMSQLDRWLHHQWPQDVGPAQPDDARIGVVMASFNTCQVLALSLFSLFRVLSDRRIARVVIVDNGSTDGSRELLQAIAGAGLADVIFNSTQRYHGPALNQGIEHLRRQHVRTDAGRQPIDYIWVLDSDALVLRHDLIDHALARTMECGACLTGEYLRDDLAPGIDGYAHPSSLILQPSVVWRRAIEAFDRGGAPGMAMQQRLVRLGLPRCNFPFMAQNYVLHLGASTLKSIKDYGSTDNAYYQWSKTHHEPHFHGNPFGAQFLEELSGTFEQEGAGGGTEAFIHSLTKGDRIELTSPRNLGDAGRQ